MDERKWVIPPHPSSKWRDGSGPSELSTLNMGHRSQRGFGGKERQTHTRCHPCPGGKHRGHLTCCVVCSLLHAKEKEKSEVPSTSSLTHDEGSPLRRRGRSRVASSRGGEEDASRCPGKDTTLSRLPGEKACSQLDLIRPKGHYGRPSHDRGWCDTWPLAVHLDVVRGIKTLETIYDVQEKSDTYTPLIE